MADVVLNHVGYGDLAYGYKPFYKREYFHNCTVLAAENAGALMPIQLRPPLPPSLLLEARRCKLSVFPRMRGTTARGLVKLASSLHSVQATCPPCCSARPAGQAPVQRQDRGLVSYVSRARARERQAAQPRATSRPGWRWTGDQPPPSLPGPSTGARSGSASSPACAT
jgi:hypothetical protein